eukprot:CAMPEP_0180650236 /NCGR_PEP_ID=MMETSP1037_2-20121125/52099_1 /TAXON_ID=632150 /ORGANISM="Azadinium spinosum, Strain 3D9" /LENGTH=63 /DNA_ID=CAMNT_0022675515 /DNA_START=66 /DNA_END=254 /DNA_ORIENTATION=+
MAAIRLALVLVLLTGTWWASSAFIPSVFTRAGPAAGNAAALRGTPNGARSQEEGTSLLAMAPL